MTKRFEAVGLAATVYTTLDDAIGNTYTRRDGSHPSTPLMFPDNPFNDNIEVAKNILDLGCGVGRNLEWIMTHTKANYIGLEPNPSMRRFFWEKQDTKWKDRVKLCADFSELDPNVKFDAVVCTFVFQHIGSRVHPEVMNIADITKKVFEYSHPDCVWIMYEHEKEEYWISSWLKECAITPSVIMGEYCGIEELTHRGSHTLIIFNKHD